MSILLISGNELIKTQKEVLYKQLFVTIYKNI